jgi:hypothetical protein
MGKVQGGRTRLHPTDGFNSFPPILRLASFKLLHLQLKVFFTTGFPFTIHDISKRFKLSVIPFC